MGNKTDMSIGPALYLGRVGSTGLSEGPHAHWVVKKDGKDFPLSQARSDIGQYLQFRLPGQEAWQAVYSQKGDGFSLNPLSPLISPMGMRKHPIHGDMRMHGGEDYGLPEGTQLRFLGTGSVATHRNNGGAGNVSSLRTGPYELQTFHLSELPDVAIAKPGDRVTGTQDASATDPLTSTDFLRNYLEEQMTYGLMQQLLQKPKKDPMAELKAMVGMMPQGTITNPLG
jgi:murein DD-endopeptidase MepM/ murein hydrolase activator NlpD